MGLLFQVICTFTICTVGFNLGFAFVWPASTIIMFASDETTLNRPMTETEISLLGSLSSIGALISTLAAGYMLDKFGRKKCCIFTAFSLIVFWIMLAASRSVEVVLTSVFLSGISCSIFLIAVVYISEICQDSIRGCMTAGNMVSYGTGMLLSYGLGGCLAYDVMLYVGLALAVAGAGVLFYLKDSPLWLMQTGKEQEAAEAIAFFRQLNPDDKAIIEEVNSIRRSLNAGLDDVTSKDEHNKLSFWQFFKKSASTRQAFFVNTVVVTAAIFQGLVVVQIYVEPLFKEAMPTASSTVCSVLMGAVVVIAGVVAAYLTDITGRRPLMIYASLGAGISCIILGTQMHFHWGPNWIMALFLCIFLTMFTFGAGTVPFVLLAELFLPEVKGVISTLLVEWTWFCQFIILFIINPLLNAVGWGSVFYIFAACCFLTSIFCVFFLPETKNLTVEQIQPLFVKKKHRSSCWSIY